jgi:hypothetical protein
VDDPRPGHRLDHGRDRLCVQLVDPAREPAQRVDIARHGELVQMLSLIGEQADVELPSAQVESSVQHMQRASLGPAVGP